MYENIINVTINVETCASLLSTLHFSNTQIEFSLIYS